MTAIIIPRKHYTQPQGRVELVEPWDFCLVNGHTMTGEVAVPVTAGVPQIVPNPSGLALKTSNTAAGKFTAPKPGRFGSCMGVAVFRRTGTLVAYARLVGSRVDGKGFALYLNNAGESQNAIRITHDAAVARGDVYGVLADSSKLSAVSFFLDKHGNHALFEEGRAITTAVSGGGDLVVTTSTFFMGTESSSSVVSPFDGEANLFALTYGRGSLEEARELSRNPWQLFRADPIRIYSFPTGAISINSIIASNITQTGARITLGLTR